MQALVLDLGGTHIGCGVVRDRSLLAHCTLDADAGGGLAALLPRVAIALRALLAEVGILPSACAGLAIGFPGVVDGRARRVHSTLKKYADAPQLNLATWSADAFALPLRLENDARMALLGECYAGAAEGAADAAMMTLGTGIGTAAMMHGRLVRGAHGHAGCLGGHCTVNLKGRLCPCGNVGCAESEGSGWALPQVATAWPGLESSSLMSGAAPGLREVFLAAAAEDSVALQIREHCLRVWAATAVSMVHAYDCDLLLLGGGVMASAATIVPFIQQYVDHHVWAGRRRTEVRAGALGTEAALMGAVPLLAEDLHAS